MMNHIEQVHPNPIEPQKPDFQFQWNDTLRLFVVRQYAEFVRAIDICDNLILSFPELCEDDLDLHGEEVFKKFLLRTIYKLTPETVVFPKKYQQHFDKYRQDYLKGVDNSYLFHSKNRFQELDNMYESLMRAASVEIDNTEKRHLMQLALNVLKESRAEQSSSKISLEAKSDSEGLTLTAIGTVSGLSDDEIKELVKRYERGESISLPRSAKPLPDVSSGNGTSEKGGGSAETERDPNAEG